jgi:hypothetical protein
MKTFFYSFPRLDITITVPDEIIGDIQTAFIHSICSRINLPTQHEYIIESTANALTLLKDGKPLQQFTSSHKLIFCLEEDVENTLIRSIGNWVGFHAGAVRIGDTACIIVGNPDVGKTTTTFNLVEMGQTFLCEEIAPVDPESLLVYPYPQVLTLEAAYAENYLSLYPVTNGEFKIFDSQMARYLPYAAESDPVPLKTILIPAYDPSEKPGIEKLTPSQVFTELLGYCFPPNGDDERLFDSVIRICEEVETFRLRTNSIQSMQELLKELIGTNPEA